MVFLDIFFPFLKSREGCAACHLFSPQYVMWRIILFFICFCITAFDCYSDWHVWISVRETGYNHPLLKIPTQWTTSWFVFSTFGTVTALLYILNELSGVVFLYCKYTSFSGNPKKADICRPCTARGCNFITRAEVLALVNITSEDLPLLVLSLIFAAAQVSCSHPTPEDNSAILKLVFISSLASLLDVGFGSLRYLFRLSQRACNDRKKTICCSKEVRRSVRENQLYPKQHQMKWCLIFHSAALALIYGLTICVSVTAIAMTQHKDVLTGSLFVDPSQKLGIYRSYPHDQLLINVSTVIDHENGACLTEEFALSTNQTLICDLAFIHKSEEGQIHFNYAQSNYSKNATMHNPDSSEPTDKCAVFYRRIFLGHLSNGRVKRFDEVCLGVLILPDSNALLQREKNISTHC